MRVPIERKVATTSVELEIPEGVTIAGIDGAAPDAERKRVGDRVTTTLIVAQ